MHYEIAVYILKKKSLNVCFLARCVSGNSVTNMFTFSILINSPCFGFVPSSNPVPSESLPTVQKLGLV